MGKAKTIIIAVVGTILVLAILGVAGFFAYKNFIAPSDNEALVNEQLQNPQTNPQTYVPVPQSQQQPQQEQQAIQGQSQPLQEIPGTQQSSDTGFALDGQKKNKETEDNDRNKEIDLDARAKDKQKEQDREKSTKPTQDNHENSTSPRQMNNMSDTSGQGSASSPQQAGLEFVKSDVSVEKRFTELFQELYDHIDNPDPALIDQSGEDNNPLTDSLKNNLLKPLDRQENEETIQTIRDIQKLPSKIKVVGQYKGDGFTILTLKQWGRGNFANHGDSNFVVKYTLIVKDKQAISLTANPDILEMEG